MTSKPALYICGRTSHHGADPFLLRRGGAADRSPAPSLGAAVPDLETRNARGPSAVSAGVRLHRVPRWTAIAGSVDHAESISSARSRRLVERRRPKRFSITYAKAHGCSRCSGQLPEVGSCRDGVAIRALGRGDGTREPIRGGARDRRALMRERSSPRHRRRGSPTRRCAGVAAAWLVAMDLDIGEATSRALQQGVLSHPDLSRRARRIHERKLAGAVREVAAMAESAQTLDVQRGALALFDACIPAISYAASSAFLGREKLKLTRSEGDRPLCAGCRRRRRYARRYSHSAANPGRGCPDSVQFGITRSRSMIIASPRAHTLLSRPESAAQPSAIVDALPEGATTSFISALRDPPRSAPGCWRACSSCRSSAAISPSWRRMQASAPPGADRGSLSGGAEWLLRILRVVLSPSPASDARLSQLGIAAERIGRWSRRRAEPLRPGLRIPVSCRASSTCSTPAA